MDICTEKKSNLRQNVRRKDKKGLALCCQKELQGTFEYFINFTKNWTVLLKQWVKYSQCFLTSSPFLRLFRTFSLNRNLWWRYVRGNSWLQRHLKAIRISPEGTKTITVFQFLEFIVKCDFFFFMDLWQTYI